MAKKRRSSGQTLEVRVALSEIPDGMEWPALAAYLHTRSGQFVAKATLGESEKGEVGVARFEITDPQKHMIVKVGPDVDDRRLLRRKDPLVRRVLLTPRDTIEVDFEIPRPNWERWFCVPYVVTGNVEKWQDGTATPVCVGEVDIYDVDVHCFWWVPDPVIEQIRDSFIDLIVDPPPVQLEELPAIAYWHEDDPYCGTPPGPRPPFPWELRARLSALPGSWSFAVNRLDARETARPRIDAVLDEMSPAARQTWLGSEATAGVRISQILYTNTDQFRHLLIDCFPCFRYWLCWYPWIYWLWWPHCHFHSRSLLGTATLEPDGSFQKTVWLPIFRRDVPDLWFVVRQTVDAVERTIYARYPVLCHTYWNHPSGDPVRLRVTDPDAVACGQGDQPDADGVYVMPLGVADDGWYSIHYAHLELPVLADLYERHAGLYEGTDPYGTRLDLRMQFHDSLRGNGVRYYRWSYNLEDGEPPDWTPIKTPIIHRYLDSIGGNYYLIPEQLGPKAVGGETHLFEVPDPTKDWIALNRNDRAFAIWNTAAPEVPDGRYTLRLEMFDDTGSPVAPSAGTFQYFLPNAAATGGLWPVNTSPKVEADGSILLHLYVDNTDTIANVESVGLSGTTTPECQFIEYTDRDDDEIEVTFTADHHPGLPRDFIRRYALSVQRGISGTLVASASQDFVPPGVIVLPPYDPPGQIVKRFKVKDLLRLVDKKGPFHKCTFTVNLHTFPRTRNGVTRIREYEAHDVSSFALVAGP